MLALWLENQQLRLKDNLPLPQLNPDEALIQVRLAGICATDLEMVKGYYPFTGILGHEFIGEVIEAPQHPEWIGKRVVGEINVTCGKCFACTHGRRNHCEQRTVLGIVNHDGVFAEFLSLPVQNLHEVPTRISDAEAVFTEPLAAALQIQQQVHIHPEDRVLLIGAGRLGLLIALSMALNGYHLTVVVRHPVQEKILGKDNIKTISSDKVTASSWDIVIEATGSPDGFQLAQKAVRPAGTIVLKSTYHGETKVNLSSVVVNEITVIGSRCGPFQPALHFMEKKLIDVEALVAARYPLDQALRGFEHASQPGVLKILLTVNQ